MDIRLVPLEIWRQDQIDPPPEKNYSLVPDRRGVGGGGGGGWNSRGAGKVSKT